MTGENETQLLCPYQDHSAATTIQRIWHGYVVRGLCVPMLYDETCCERCGGWDYVLQTRCFHCTHPDTEEEDWNAPRFAAVGARSIPLPLGFFRRRTDIGKWERREEVRRQVLRRQRELSPPGGN